MSVVKIFSDIILKRKIINPALDKQILQVLKREEQKKEKIVKSNRGGFHSPYIKDKKIYQILLKTSGDLISSCLPFKSKTNVSINNLWIMKNKKNDWNVPHTHPNSNFSGIYYVEVPKKGGELFFLENKKEKKYKLKALSCMIFPSGGERYVDFISILFITYGSAP